jgi:hypothetical protein
MQSGERAASSDCKPVNKVRTVLVDRPRPRSVDCRTLIYVSGAHYRLRSVHLLFAANVLGALAWSVKQVARLAAGVSAEEFRCLIAYVVSRLV